MSLFPIAKGVVKATPFLPAVVKDLDNYFLMVLRNLAIAPVQLVWLVPVTI